MKADLNITLVQTALYWENPEDNLHLFTQKIDQITGPSDLILLPEMFTTGFSMKPEQFAETMDGSTLQWMKKIAKEKNAVICGSLMIKHLNTYYNRLIWMPPEGNAGFYDKRHLFALGEEADHYSGGAQKLLVELKGWKILPLICYDLRFPVWCRNTDNYDVLLFVANWPERRIQAWKTLLQARAIENQCFVLGVNRIGEDGNGVYYSGESSVMDPKGELLFQQADSEQVYTITLSYDHLYHIRKSLPFLQDRDTFILKQADH
jgi:predicted amidohydrolase